MSLFNLLCTTLLHLFVINWTGKWLWHHLNRRSLLQFPIYSTLHNCSGWNNQFISSILLILSPWLVSLCHKFSRGINTTTHLINRVATLGIQSGDVLDSRSGGRKLRGRHDMTITWPMHCRKRHHGGGGALAEWSSFPLLSQNFSSNLEYYIKKSIRFQCTFYLPLPSHSLLCCSSSRQTASEEAYLW